MIDRAAIQAILDQHHIQLSGEPIQHGEQPNHAYFFVSVERDRDNRQVPSNAKLKAVGELFLGSGLTVDFLLTDGATRDAEAGLRATVLHAFGNDVRNVFLTVDGQAAHVWIDPKRQLSDVVQKEISNKATIFLRELDLQLSSLTSMKGENLPSSFAVLRAIRQLAPVDAADLSLYLSEKGFSVPSIDWLNRRLDGVRKAGRIVRLGTGKYVLTLSCIRELGTKKGRHSPDILRLLALAARRTYPA